MKNGTLLKSPFSVLITPRIASKYFGDKNPVGRILNYKNKASAQRYDFTVTGIIEAPGNSHIRVDFLASMNSLRHVDFVSDGYFTRGRGPAWTYVLLREGVDAEALGERLPDFVERHVDKGSAAWLTMELDRRLHFARSLWSSSSWFL